MPQSLLRHALLGIIAGLLVVGCTPAAPAITTPTPASTPAGAGSPGGGTGAVATPAPASASPATPAASPTPTSAATSGATAGTAQVDLHFTGAKTFDAVGSAGRCSLGTPVGGGLPSFGFEATEADYPGMGLSFSLLQFAGADYVDLKWTIDASTIYGQAGPVYTAGPNTITLSPDHRMVTLDAQLSGFAPQGQAPPGPGHVTGTITCP